MATLQYLGKVPLLKRFVNQWLFKNLSLAYDIYATYLNCHEEALQLWNEFNQEDEFDTEIENMKESSDAMLEAEVVSQME